MTDAFVCPHCKTRNDGTNRACYCCGKMAVAPSAINEYADLGSHLGATKNGKPMVYWGEGDPYLNASFRAWRKVTKWLLQEENLIIFAAMGWITIVTICTLLVLSL